MEKESQLTAFIVGLGSAGRRHLKNLQSLGVKNITLIRTGKSTLPDEELSGYKVENDLKKALKNNKPDMIIIANPTAKHIPIAIEGAKAGCHLFIEKPLSNNLKGLD